MLGWHPLLAAVPLSPELVSAAGGPELGVPKALPSTERPQAGAFPIPLHAGDTQIPWWHQGPPSAQLCSSPAKKPQQDFSRAAGIGQGGFPAH